MNAKSGIVQTKIGFLPILSATSPVSKDPKNNPSKDAAPIAPSHHVFKPKGVVARARAMPTTPKI